jgi:hypothetical protein
MPDKLTKLLKISSLVYGMEDHIGRYFWSRCEFAECEVPEQIISSKIEINEEYLIRFEHKLDQLNIKCEEKSDFVELEPCPEVMCIEEEKTPKKKIQAKIKKIFFCKLTYLINKIIF